MKKAIGIFGISHVSNFGCEAIVRSTYSVLKAVEPDCEIIYYTRNYKNDIEYIGDLDMKITQISRKVDIISRVLNKIFSLFGSRYRIAFDDYKKICRETSHVLSVGGDLYTMDKADQKNERFVCYNRMVQFGEYAKKRGVKIIIYGASIGPFGNAPGNKAYFFDHFKKVDLIVCRESVSIDYLRENGVSSNVIFSPDPAYYVVGDVGDVSEEQKHGIIVNLSRRMLQKNGVPQAEQKKNMADLLLRLICETDEDIVLLPHVLSTSNFDDDLSFLREINALIPENCRERIKLIEDCRGFLAAKRILMSGKMVIAARMHCAINAMSESVPTILLSYSEKSIGMARYIYGTGKWVISASDMFTTLPERVNEMFSQRETISEELRSRIDQIRGKAERKEFLQNMERIIHE